MFKPCPNCGFLVALIAGREASQRCPRCGSAMLEDGERPPVDEAPAKPAAMRSGGVDGGDTSSMHAREARRDTGDDAAAAVTREDPLRDGSAGTSADARGAPRPDDATGTQRTARLQHTRSPATAPVADDAPMAPTGDYEPVGTPAAAAPAPSSASAGNAAVVDVDARANTGAGDTDTRADADADADADAVHAPSFTTRGSRRPKSRHGRRWPWAVALPLLALLLAVQLLLSQRAELAQDATWRPLVGATCRVLGCDVPPWREPSAFAMLARNVRPHGARAGVLHVTTSLRNDAPWPQPLPVVVLSLSDVDGRVLAARAVPPKDYGRTATTLVGPGDSVDIAFDVREPSPRVVSFDFQLR